MKDYVFNKHDIETAKIVDDFLPGKLFDAHMHISHFNLDFAGHTTFDKYYEDIGLFSKDRTVHCNGIISPKSELLNPEEMDNSIKFLCAELNKHTQNVGEIMVFPTDTVDEIKARLVHNRIRGLKCYHIYAHRPDTINASLEEYLPESALMVANEKKMAITIHLVKNEALAHPDNLRYIINMSKKYPDAVLILAHAARAFAAWTVFDVVDKLVDCENVWFDFSAICESPAMLYILKKVGAKRCMWGTDYPISMLAGKAISIADTFYWIGTEELMHFAGKGNINSWHIMTEGFMAMRQACILADLDSSEIEDIFYNNANKLFSR